MVRRSWIFKSGSHPHIYVAGSRGPPLQAEVTIHIYTIVLGLGMALHHRMYRSCMYRIDKDKEKIVYIHDEMRARAKTSLKNEIPTCESWRFSTLVPRTRIVIVFLLTVTHSDDFT